METSKERIEKLLAHIKKSKNAAGVLIGDKNGMRFTHVINGRNEISEKFASDIVAKFPEISYSWLMSGEGEMLRADLDHVEEEQSSSYLRNIEVTHLDGERSSIMQVPLVNQFAYAGYLNGFADDEFIENLPRIPWILDKEYKGEYLCFQVKGDSMECDSEESIPEGTILLCRNVRQDYWKSKLHINKWDFVIVHKTDGILVKRILNHDVDQGTIRIHSLNDMYPDRDLHLKDIQQIFNIVEIQSKRKRRFGYSNDDKKSLEEYKAELEGLLSEIKKANAKLGK